MDELEDNSSTTTADAPLTMSEAVKALTATKPADDVDTDQAEADEAQEDHADEDLTAEEEVEDEEGETGTEDQAEEGEQDDETEAEIGQGRFAGDDAKVRIQNPDGTVEFATVAELKAGNLRNADATKKWQEAADLKRTAEAESATTKQLRQQLADQRDYVSKLIESIVPKMPGPDVLADDPQGYLEQRAQAEQWAEHLQYLKEQTQRDNQSRQAETQKEVKARLAKEWTTALEKLPELSDPKRLEAFGKDTVKYGAAYGYTDEDMSTIHHDHRQLLVFKDAIAWRKLQERQKAAKPAPKGPERPPVLKGGKRLNPKATKHRQANAAMERLNETGSLRDGVQALLARQKG